MGGLDPEILPKQTNKQNQNIKGYTHGRQNCQPMHTGSAAAPAIVLVSPPPPPYTHRGDMIMMLLAGA
jgi:hypothetical protein